MAYLTNCVVEILRESTALNVRLHFSVYIFSCELGQQWREGYKTGGLVLTADLKDAGYDLKRKDTYLLFKLRFILLLSLVDTRLAICL